jgi:hypothetical protein
VLGRRRPSRKSGTNLFAARELRRQLDRLPDGDELGPGPGHGDILPLLHGPSLPARPLRSAKGPETRHRDHEDDRAEDPLPVPEPQPRAAEGERAEDQPDGNDPGRPTHRASIEPESAAQRVRRRRYGPAPVRLVVARCGVTCERVSDKMSLLW